MTASVTVKAHLDARVISRAYRELGKRLAGNLVKRAARAALAPVREKTRAAWLAQSYREGSRPKRIAIEKSRVVTRRPSAKQLQKGLQEMYEAYWEARAGIARTTKVRKPRTHRTIRRRWRRMKRPQPIVVRRAIARSTGLEVDKRSNGTFVAAVGVDYSKAGVKRQQKFMHILERGRTGRGALPGRHVSEAVNRAEQGPTEERFMRAMEKGILDGVD